MHGHIETISIMPQRLYRLFDTPVGFGPFSSSHFRSVMIKLPKMSVWDFGFVTGPDCSSAILSCPLRARKSCFGRLSHVGESIGDPVGVDNLAILHGDCAHSNFVSSGHACARLIATRLGSVHLPGDAREKESPLPVYDPKVEGR
ncbi:hypothetical protein CRG98_018368 [Punica granatum]|uniref:Uncharacterized protein n=1 Tax=Punica granatum TaxID=22663 RepID=A0A2I0JZF2_PUNGR|nr:hypothetical protein CRG98_018368 [Punica granatum]